jgi:dipeptidyl aminopeptidase/acylaminoacyl peptidase
MNRSVICFYFLSCALAFNACSQDLGRRAFLGVQMQPLSVQARNQYAVPGVTGVLVTRVVPGSSAAMSGLLINDIITHVNAKNISTVDEVLQALLSLLAGDNFSLGIIRDRKNTTIQGKIMAFPAERYADFDVVYGQVTSGNSVLRTIITKPKGSDKHPLVFYVQGVGCGSVDWGADTTNAESRLIQQLTRKGFVTLRVDKSGTGDSKGDPCNALDFRSELQGYQDALEKVRKENYIDSDNVFLFGHSMGGVMAPIIAEKTNINGIIVYGTIVKSAVEYFLESRRIQAGILQMNPVETDRYLKLWSEASVRYFYTDEPVEQLSRTMPDFSQFEQAVGFRSRTYWKQFASTAVVESWSRFKGPVLAGWGTLDFISNKSDHELLSELVNVYSPGKGELAISQLCTHELTEAQSIADALTQTRKMPCDKFIQRAVTWLSSKMGQQPLHDQVTDTRLDATITEVLKMDGVENAYPHWSTEGSRILFQSNRTGKWQIYVMDRDGKNEKRITQDKFNNNFIDWSPDEKKIAFVSDRDGNEEIYIMNSDGSQVQRLTQNPFRDIHPYFSPDGKSILFNSTSSESGQLDIFQMDLTGKIIRRLTNSPDEETCARFSPDMKKIVYLKYDLKSANDEVFVMNADGSSQMNFTNSVAAEGWPCWSGDGRKIIFASTSNARFSLFEMDAAGKNLKRLTNPGPPYFDARPHLHKGTGAIVFNRQSPGTIGIYILTPGK